MTKEIHCADSGLPSLVSIAKTYGDDFLEAYISGWIINLQEFINVGKNMSDAQIEETAFLICSEFKQLNIADVNMIFRKAKMGDFGQFYDRLDGQMILLWFEKHFDDRCNACAERSISEAQSKKGADMDSPSRIQKIIAKLKKPI